MKGSGLGEGNGLSIPSSGWKRRAWALLINANASEPFVGSDHVLGSRVLELSRKAAFGLIPLVRYFVEIEQNIDIGLLLLSK